MKITAWDRVNEPSTLGMKRLVIMLLEAGQEGVGTWTSSAAGEHCHRPHTHWLPGTVASAPTHEGFRVNPSFFPTGTLMGPSVVAGPGGEPWLTRSSVRLEWDKVSSSEPLCARHHSCCLFGCLLGSTDSAVLVPCVDQFGKQHHPAHCTMIHSSLRRPTPACWDRFVHVCAWVCHHETHNS